MKSKEAIRNKILAYTNLIWGTRKIDRLDMLVQMMVEELANELYLVQHRLKSIDMALLEKIAKKLTPESYIAVRPAHTILHIRPEQAPKLMLDRHTSFSMEWAARTAEDKNDITVFFYPVADTPLWNIKISNIIHGDHFCSVNNTGRWETIARTDPRTARYSIWLGLDIDPEIEHLEDLSFYIDFPALSEIHELYDVLPFTKCFIDGQEVRLRKGLPVRQRENMTAADTDILGIYDDHFLTIDEAIPVSSLRQEKIPEALRPALPGEFAEGLTPKYWIQLLFPPNFTDEYLSRMFIMLNAFPVSNRRPVKTTILKANLQQSNSLASRPGEKLLFIESVTDNRGRVLQPDTSSGNNEAGTYHQEVNNKVFIEELSLIDYIEQLSDLMDNERTVFSGIDKDRVSELLADAKAAESNRSFKALNNRKTKDEIVTRLSLQPHGHTSFVNVHYWVSYGEEVNHIPAERILTPDKASSLDGLYALSLCETHGAREFSDIRDILSVDRYIFTSKDRIVTEHHIRSFCESELGRCLEKVTVSLTGRISPKPSEGLIRVIRVDLTPTEGKAALLRRKGILKSLKICLQRRSPDDYIYDIQLQQPD